MIDSKCGGERKGGKREFHRGQAVNGLEIWFLPPLVLLFMNGETGPMIACENLCIEKVK